MKTVVCFMRTFQWSVESHSSSNLVDCSCVWCM